MNKAENPRKALGRGLSTLLPTRTPAPPPAPEFRPAAANEPAHMLPVDQIHKNPLQPRRTFEPEALAELAQSIRANGIIQPLIVRKVNGQFQLVAGERRLRAAKLAQLETVPVVVRDIPDDRLLEITLIENIQREDLNPIETAIAFERLLRELHIGAEAVGQRTGKDRTTIVNTIRLLQLPSDLQQLVAERKLTAGHARCLLSLPTVDAQHDAAEKAVQNGWSVRYLEAFTQKLLAGKKAPDTDEGHVDPNVKAALQEMQRVLGTRVRIVEKPKQKGGRIEIDYYSQEDLDRIYSAIVGEP
jgi:ParB family transcriptional regulator, chromosome partitioning protein